MLWSAVAVTVQLSSRTLQKLVEFVELDKVTKNIKLSKYHKVADTGVLSKDTALCSSVLVQNFALFCVCVVKDSVNDSCTKPKPFSRMAIWKLHGKKWTRGGVSVRPS